MIAKLRSHEQMVDRLARRWARLVLKQTLVDWKKLVIRKKYTRVLFDKTSGRWSKQRLHRVFRAWSAFAVTERVRRAHDQIQQFREGRLELQELLVKLHTQIDNAKAEARSHREHMDYSKRHLMSLEELFAQLELRVKNSQERKLQEISNQWGQLCFALVDCQCDYLQNMLDSVPLEEFVDASLLLSRGEEIGDLLALPSDALVLRWINFQLAQCETFRSYYVSSPAGFIQNFSSDMHRHYVLRHIMHRIISLKGVNGCGKVFSCDASSRRDSYQTSRMSPDRRGSSAMPDYVTPFSNDDDLCAALSEQLDPPCPPMLSMLSYGERNSDIIFCLFGFLMCEHPSMIVAPAPTAGSQASASALRTTNTSAFPVISPWQEARVALEDTRSVWSVIRDQWSELREPFEIQETTKMSPDMTAPPHLLARANIALQNAVHSVQYACSKRSIATRTWECLQRRIQEDALRLLIHRGRVNENPETLLPIELVDRRMWREKFMLTTLHKDKLVGVFTRMGLGIRANDSATIAPDPTPEQREQVEAELAQVEDVLQEHYEAMRQVYRFYASIDVATSDGGTSSPQSRTGSDEERFFRKIAVSMSLQEFHVFLKDCKMFGTARSFPYEFIQQVFEHVNSDVAASAESATVRQLPSHFQVVAMPDDNSFDDDNPSEMTPGEFVEALVHIVRSKHICFRTYRGGVSSLVAGLTLAQRMRRCIEEIILPNAMQEKDKSNIFRPLLLSSDCRAVFSTHFKRLLQVYSHFASATGSGRMLSVDGLVAACKHFDLFRDNLVNLDDIQHILANVLQLDREIIHFSTSSEEQQAAPISPVPQAEGESASAPLLTVAEFLEVLAALACYLHPDAFVPLAAKLDAFFADLRL